MASPSIVEDNVMPLPPVTGVDPDAKTPDDIKARKDCGTLQKPQPSPTRICMCVAQFLVTGGEPTFGSIVDP